MPISAAMRAANQANARRSTGPRTLSGKARARLNALKHGLTGRTVVLPGEEEGVAALEADMAARFGPEGEIERALVRDMAQALWRVGRAPGAEAAALLANADEALYDENPMAATLGAPGAVDILLRVSRYEAQLRRAHERARERLLQLKQARAMQAASERRPAEPPKPAPAAPRLAEKPPFPAANGFVSSRPPKPPGGALARDLLGSASPLALGPAPPHAGRPGP